MKLNSVIIIILIFSCFSVLGQVTKIGEVEFEISENDFKPTGTLFGQIEVFEDNISNTGRKINLYVEVIPSINPDSKAAPIFIIMGGPGQASSDLVPFFSSIFEKINEKSDLVFIDQRGTGKSNPLKILMQYDSVQDYFKDKYMSDQIIKRSLDSLSVKNNLKLYGTRNATLDIEKVRTAMGYEKVNLYGTSYGTRVALSYINTFPENVRTATLKGLVPNSLIIPSLFAKDSQRSLELLIEDCKNNQECLSSFPEFEKEFNDFLSGSFPIKVEIRNPESELIESVEIRKESVAMTLRSLLAVPTFTQQIPFLISEANKKNYSPLVELIFKINRSYANRLYDAMMLCVICYEDYPKLIRSNPENTENTFLQNIWIDRVMNACEIWNPKKEEAGLIESKKQKLPILLISGGRDSATPPKYGVEVLDKFPNGRHLIIQQAGHSFDRMLDCVENIINDFVITGNTSQINTDCISTIKYPSFKLK